MYQQTRDMITCSIETSHDQAMQARNFQNVAYLCFNLCKFKIQFDSICIEWLNNVYGSCMLKHGCKWTERERVNHRSTTCKGCTCFYCVFQGCRLRNTEWMYGVVIYAGADTKLVQNSGELGCLVNGCGRDWAPLKQ